MKPITNQISHFDHHSNFNLLPSRQIIGSYCLGETIGRGTFGKVKVGVHIQTNEKVAVKILEKEMIVTESNVASIQSEIHILSQLYHPNISQLLEIIETQTCYYLVLEFAANGELFSLIAKRGRLSEVEACLVFAQALSALEYLHDQDICHRDLKPENMLFDSSYELKIIDFGLGKISKEKLTTCCGSPCYASPETLSGVPYQGKYSDLWSLGIVLFGMLCGFLPFDEDNPKDLFESIKKCQYEVPSALSPEATEVIKGLLKRDPTQRMSIYSLKQTIFYKKHLEGVIVGKGIILEKEQLPPLDQSILKEMVNLGYEQHNIRKDVYEKALSSTSAAYYLLLSKKKRGELKELVKESIENEIAKDSKQPEILQQQIQAQILKDYSFTLPENQIHAKCTPSFSIYYPPQQSPSSSIAVFDGVNYFDNEFIEQCTQKQLQDINKVRVCSPEQKQAESPHCNINLQISKKQKSNLPVFNKNQNNFDSPSNQFNIFLPHKTYSQVQNDQLILIDQKNNTSLSPPSQIKRLKFRQNLQKQAKKNQEDLLCINIASPLNIQEKKKELKKKQQLNSISAAYQTTRDDKASNSFAQKAQGKVTLQQVRELLCSPQAGRNRNNPTKQIKEIKVSSTSTQETKKFINSQILTKFVEIPINFDLRKGQESINSSTIHSKKHRSTQSQGVPGQFEVSSTLKQKQITPLYRKRSSSVLAIISEQPNKLNILHSSPNNLSFDFKNTFSINEGQSLVSCSSLKKSISQEKSQTRNSSSLNKNNTVRNTSTSIEQSQQKQVPPKQGLQCYSSSKRSVIHQKTLSQDFFKKESQRQEDCIYLKKSAVTTTKDQLLINENLQSQSSLNQRGTIYNSKFQFNQQRCDSPIKKQISNRDTRMFQSYQNKDFSISQTNFKKDNTLIEISKEGLNSSESKSVEKKEKVLSKDQSHFKILIEKFKIYGKQKDLKQYQERNDKRDNQQHSSNNSLEKSRDHSNNIFSTRLDRLLNKQSLSTHNDNKNKTSSKEGGNIPENNPNFCTSKEAKKDALKNEFKLPIFNQLLDLLNSPKNLNQPRKQQNISPINIVRNFNQQKMRKNQIGGRDLSLSICEMSKQQSENNGSDYPKKDLTKQNYSNALLQLMTSRVKVTPSQMMHFKKHPNSQSIDLNAN